MPSEDHGGQTRIMLVEDHPDFRDLMADLIGRQADLEVVAQAGSLAEARNHAAAVSFDVAILDLGLPDGNGADMIADLRGINPGVSVLVLSTNLDPKSLERATQAGADEILDKFATPGEVLGTIRRLGGG
jgi:DNA-binding NarL/FixJ family response regulator